MLGGLGVMKKAGWYEASLWCVTMDNGAPRSRHVTPPQANHRQNISAHASYYSCPQHTAWWRSHAIHHQNLNQPWQMPIPPTQCSLGKRSPPLYKMFCHHPPHIRHPGISPGDLPPSQLRISVEGALSFRKPVTLQAGFGRRLRREETNLRRPGVSPGPEGSRN